MLQCYLEERYRNLDTGLLSRQKFSKSRSIIY